VSSDTPRDALAKIPIKVVRRPDERRPWGMPFAKWAKHRRKAFELTMRALTSGASTVPEGADAKVPCDGCTACCRSGLDIELQKLETGEGLDTFEKDGIRWLRRNSDGSCIHFVEGRCAVYSRRPISCRTYDCRDRAVAGLLHSPMDVPANEVIMSWMQETKTKEDADVYTVLGLLMAALCLKGMSADRAYLTALQGYPQFLSEADGMRAWAVRGLANNPLAQSAVDELHDPSATTAGIERLLAAFDQS
jgi:hypothetical protein